MIFEKYNNISLVILSTNAYQQLIVMNTKQVEEIKLMTFKRKTLINILLINLNTDKHKII